MGALLVIANKLAFKVGTSLIFKGDIIEHFWGSHKAICYPNLDDKGKITLS